MQTIVVYVSDQCIQSERLLSFLDDFKINYQKKNISRKQENRKELQRQNVFSTPATFINGDKVLGFPESQLKRKLGIQPRDERD